MSAADARRTAAADRAAAAAALLGAAGAAGVAHEGNCALALYLE